MRVLRNGWDQAESGSRCGVGSRARSVMTREDLSRSRLVALVAVAVVAVVGVVAGTTGSETDKGAWESETRPLTLQLPMRVDLAQRQRPEVRD